MKKIIYLLIMFLVLGLVGNVWAHQPRLVSDRINIKVEQPEVSKAYYDKLSGNPVVYQIESEQPFVLYVNLLVPAIDNIRKDFIIEIRKGGTLLDILNGGSSNWTEFYEPFGRDNYLKGPEFRQEVEPGTYEIEIFNNDYKGKYILAIGEKEEFPLKEIIKTSFILPVLKVSFFEKSPLTVFFNLAGVFWLIIIILVLAILFILKKLKERVFNQRID